MRDAKFRFTDRVVDYLKYRPSYPNAVVDLIGERFRLGKDAVIADVGAGTGIFTRQLLNAGYEVFAVEPNHAMRQAAENQLMDFDGFKCIAGSAEQTELPDRQVDLVTAAQAFHWFEFESAQAEFRRVTRPPHRVMLVWNDRRNGDGGFNDAYEQFLLRWCDEYVNVRSNCQDDERLKKFFAGKLPDCSVFANHQLMNWEATQGRVKSCSYVPGPEDPRHVPMMCELRHLFDQFQQSGKVQIVYDTRVYCGQLGEE